MPSLIELVEMVNAGDGVDAADLAAYQQSTNAAERFLGHHAGATLGLRQCHAHLSQALQAVGYADRKVLEQYAGLCAFVGQEYLRTGPAVKFGRGAISRGEVALGLEALASAVATDLSRGWAWSADLGNGVELCRAYAEAAAAVGWTRPGNAPRDASSAGDQIRVAYVVSSLGDDEPAARAATALAKNLDHKRYRLGVYSTEAWCRRDRQTWAEGATLAPSGVMTGSSAKRGGGTIARLSQSKAGHWIAPTTGPAGGDLAAAAVALADKLAEDRVDVVVVDADPSDAVAGVAVQWPVAKGVLWVARRVPLYAETVGAAAYLDPTRCAADEAYWRGRGATCTPLVEGVDLDAPATEAPRRSAYGIPESAVILTTAADDVARTVTPELIDGVAETLRRHPQAVYLLVGGGDATGIRKRFEAAGVGKRVGYAGKRRDLPGFLRMADVYVGEFPEASPAGVLQAMSMGLATVAVACDDSPAQIVACEFVGSEATIQESGAEAFAERVGRLVRDGAYRQQQGLAMRRRVEQHFSYEQTARGIEGLCAALLSPAGVEDETAEGVTLGGASDRVAA